MSTLQLLAADGNHLSAYLVKPEGAPRGAVVVNQEIFGVNSHIRSVADGSSSLTALGVIRWRLP